MEKKANTAPDGQGQEREMANTLTLEERVEQYKEHMRQVLHHQQEAYFCMVGILHQLMDHE